MECHPGGQSRINAPPEPGPHAGTDKQRLTAVLQKLTFLRLAGFKGQQFPSEFFHTQHQAEVDGVIVDGQVAQVGLEAQNHLLCPVILQHGATALWRVLVAAGLVDPQLRLGVEQSRHQLAITALHQVGRVVVGGGEASIEQ